MNDIQIFNNPEFGEVRTVMIDGEPWFCGKDVCKGLGYTKTTQAIHNNVDMEDTLKKGLLDSRGIEQETIVVNESGLYSLIFGSKLESAKKFKRWVTAEVLPQLRKTGSYGTAPQLPMTTREQIQLLAKGNEELNQRMDTITERMDRIELDLPILPIEADRITTAVKKKGVAVLGGKQSSAYKNRALRQKLYNNLYANLKYNFSVRSYKSIKRSQTDKAIEIVGNYQPPFFLANQIEAENAQMSI